MEKLILTQSQKKFYQENGYLHIKSVFTPEEVQMFRSTALKETKEAGDNKYSVRNPEGVISTVDLLSHEVFQKFLMKLELISALKELLDDEPVYFGVSCVSVNFYKKTIEKHRDNIDFNNANGKDWEGKYSITRVGLYLQDHTENGGNIWFTPESHKGFRTKKKPETFEYKAGDLVIWSLLTEHSVSALPRNILKGKKMPSLLEILYFRLLKPFLTRPFPTSAYPKEENPRIFMTAIFGGKSDNFNVNRIINRRNHQAWNWKYKIFNNTKSYSPETLFEANESGLRLNLKHVLNKSEPYNIV